jgi:hypothetical protein
VVAEGGDHVIGGHAFAVVEGEALVQLEDPGRGVGGGLEALGQIADHVAPGVHLGQAVGARSPERDLRAHVRPSARIEAVGGGPLWNAEACQAAAFRGGGDTGAAQHRGCQCRAGTERHGAPHELAPRDAAFCDLFEPVFQFGHLLPP